jgi:ParB family chromosome partitioning protein
MQVPVKDIIVKRRIRRDMGDITTLAESMKRYGQISPIMVTRKNVLVAGGRRLEAAKSLGWKTINTVVVDVSDKLDKLEYEIEENIQRQNFSGEEIAQATKELNRLRNPGFFRRIWNTIAAFFIRLFRISE